MANKKSKKKNRKMMWTAILVIGIVLIVFGIMFIFQEGGLQQVLQFNSVAQPVGGGRGGL